MYCTAISRIVKIKDVKQLQQGTENDPIIKDQMVNLGCFLMCMFGNYLAPVLVDKLDVGDEQGPEDEDYESD